MPSLDPIQLDNVHPLHNTEHMPTIHRLPNCKIDIRTRDHRPAHVHILLSDGREALVFLDDMSTVSRQRIRPGEIAEAMEWIAERAHELINLFEELQK